MIAAKQSRRTKKLPPPAPPALPSNEPYLPPGVRAMLLAAAAYPPPQPPVAQDAPQPNPAYPKTELEAQARAIKEVAAPAALASCATKVFGGWITQAGFKAYLETTLTDAGAPTDPIERMLIEQMVVAHHVALGLLAKAADANPSAAEILHSTALRFMTEYRKGAITIKAYRAPHAPAQIAVVNQPAVTVNGAPTATEQAGEPTSSNLSCDTQVSTNGYTFNRITDYNPQPAPCGCWQEESAETPGAIN